MGASLNNIFFKNFKLLNYGGIVGAEEYTELLSAYSTLTTLFPEQVTPLH